MNVLFLSLLDFRTFEDRNIYSDLLREFIRNGHRVCCISPVERRSGEGTRLIEFGANSILKLRIGNIQKVGLIEKGISTLQIESRFIRGIRKYYPDVRFDLVLYATPPITFEKVIRFVKTRDGARSYLMLKDIFPQNSLDLGMLKVGGVKGFVYRYFRWKERRLYEISDKIGCMSKANAEYIQKHDPELSPDKVEICPNCIEYKDLRISADERLELRKRYGFPFLKKLFVYGGNLGRPQDVPFIVECLKVCADIPEAHFVIAGSGTDRHFLAEYIEAERPSHVSLLGQLPKDEYDRMIACCDVGLIFLDHRFSIPNFPSRLLSYMQAGLSVLACTDSSTDIGEVIVSGGFGSWCESRDPRDFAERVREMLCDTTEMGERGVEYFVKNFTSERGYEIITAGISEGGSDDQYCDTAI